MKEILNVQKHYLQEWDKVQTDFLTIRQNRVGHPAGAVKYKEAAND